MKEKHAYTKNYVANKEIPGSTISFYTWRSISLKYVLYDIYNSFLIHNKLSQAIAFKWSLSFLGKI